MVGPDAHYRGFTITLGYTTIRRTTLDEWSAQRWDFYLIIYNTNNRQASLALAGFQNTIKVSERPHSDALDCAAVESRLALNHLFKD